MIHSIFPFVSDISNGQNKNYSQDQDNILIQYHFIFDHYQNDFTLDKKCTQRNLRMRM